MKSFNLFAVLMASAALAACGGGGGDSEDAPADAPAEDSAASTMESSAEDMATEASAEASEAASEAESAMSDMAADASEAAQGAADAMNEAAQDAADAVEGAANDAAAAAGDSFPNSGRVFLRVANAHLSSARTVTVVSQLPSGALPQGAAKTDLDVSVPAAALRRRPDVRQAEADLKQAVAGIGVLVGLTGAAALTRSMASLLFEISPLDPVTFGGVAAAVTAVALLACYLPARRAAGLDPVDALRD